MIEGDHIFAFFASLTYKEKHIDVLIRILRGKSI